MQVRLVLIKIIAVSILIYWCRSAFVVSGQRLRRQSDLSYGSPTYKFCECGRKNEVLVGDIRVVGGEQVAMNEYPWMALITVKKSEPLCGGTLINDRYVVTAAHCFNGGYRQEEIKVTLGEHDLCEASAQTVRFSVEKLITHPGYSNATEYADIALVRLNMRVTFDKFIRPICLPKYDPKLSTPKKFRNKFATVLGWGYANVPHEVCVLRSVNLEIFRREKCWRNVQTAFCAGLNNGGRDACAGDSGGPLQIVNPKERYELIGVASAGIGCGDGYPGLYTDVVAMMPWIMKITTRDSMYCWR